MNATSELSDISSRLDSVKGAVESLACKVDDEARQSEAWTIHDALRAIEHDVNALQDEGEG